MLTKMKSWEKQKMVNKVRAFTSGENQFYPTPKALIDKMLKDLNRSEYRTILEPSAGTGNIVMDLIQEKQYPPQVDCIEYDPEIRTLLKYNFSDEKYRQIYDRKEKLKEKQSKYEEYIKAVNDLKSENTSEWYKNKCREIVKNPVSPLTVNEKIELTTLINELGRLENRNNVKIIHDDFLTFNTYKKYDLIIMNPPFDKGDLHLLHALELQENGGMVISLLNAETLKNAYTKSRQLLKQKLEDYNAEIEYFTGEFATAETERKTDVEVALIKVKISVKHKSSFIIEDLKRAKEEEQAQYEHEATELVSGNWIEQLVEQFNFELEITKRFIEEYKAIKPYILNSFGEYSSPVLDLYVQGKSIEYCDKNKYVKILREKYWRAFFNKPEFERLLTSNLKEKYDNVVDNMGDYDFTLYNAYSIMADLMKNLTGGLEDTILALFEKLTAKYSWFSDGDKNIHYYNGWKTNKAWIINKKVIIPMNGAFAYDYFYKKYDDKFNLSGVYSILADIERTLDYLDGGHNTNNTDLYATLKRACESFITRKISCKYFNITVYKKGTCHIEFTDLELLKKLNLFGSQKKGWLPPTYGKKAYKDMTQEEQEVIDSFQGEEDYNAVMANAEYYLAPVSSNQMLFLSAAQEG